MKVLSEDKISTLLKENKLSKESFRKSASTGVPLQKPEPKDANAMAMARHTAAIERLCALLEQVLSKKASPENPASLMPAIRNEMELSLEGVGKEIKIGIDKLSKAMIDARVKTTKKDVHWRFDIHRDNQGKIDHVSAEKEE